MECVIATRVERGVQSGKRQAKPLARPILRILAGFADRTRPGLVQIVVTRRCNLDCGYCNEYDLVSNPIDFDILRRRLDLLADMGTVFVTLTGGEPLLHPRLDELVAHASSRGMACTMISNTYALTRDWIERLNNSGLWMMQVSVDNLEPNDFSRKSWSKIKDRLELLRDHAKFSVNVNAVLGSSPPEETRQLVDQIRGLGFYMTVGLMHDDDGAIDPGLVGEELPAFYAEMRRKCRKSMFHGAGEGWEERMLQGLTAPYSCRAGARFLYIDEFGIVSYCSQKRGEPGIPIEEYSRAHRYEAYGAPKDCADQCTLSCVRRASAYDEWYPQKAASR